MAQNHLGRVLIVDDDPGVRRVCQRVLAIEGWDVTVADNGRAALEALQNSGEFDCVLTDVNMPEVNGFELVQAVRAKDDDIPVLMMTGDPSLDGAVRAIDYGAVSYITKPFTSNEALASAVARAARRHGVTRMRRRAELFQRELHGGAAEASSIDVEQRFARAIASSWMAFQPIVDMRERKVFAYEALLRTDEQSLRRPDIFIAVAERLDKVHLLGRTVRAHVAEAAKNAPAGVNLFVNLHGLDLADEELFSATSGLAGIAPRVVLEITERTGLDSAAGPSRVAMLRKLGYRVAVDDLGAGYAALGALASLEPEIVKLDMSLVRDIERHPVKQRVVTAIANLCKELGSRVVGEGVETRAELDAMTAAGIDLIQGYLIAKPERGFQPVLL